MLPVLEDPVLSERWSEGTFDLDSLLAYSAVCGTGLDAIPLPGDVSQEQLERIMGDMASLAFKWHKPLTARLIPAPGKMMPHIILASRVIVCSFKAAVGSDPL